MQEDQCQCSPLDNCLVSPPDVVNMSNILLNWNKFSEIMKMIIGFLKLEGCGCD